MSEKPISLVGAGPVGCLIAAALSESRHHFEWLVRDDYRRASLGNGLSLVVDGRETTVSPEHYSLQASAKNEPGLLILAVRSLDVDRTLEQQKIRRPRQTAVVANGLLRGDFTLGLLFGGAYFEEGKLLTGSRNRMRYGELGKEAVSALGELLDCSFLRTERVEDIETSMWEKLSLNCVVNPLSGLLGCPNGDLLKFLSAPVVISLLQEISAVAQAQLGGRWNLSPADLRIELEELLQATAYNISSMLRDINSGRETEISMLNLALVRRGRELGLPCPVCEALSASIIAVANKPAL